MLLCLLCFGFWLGGWGCRGGEMDIDMAHYDLRLKHTYPAINMTCRIESHITTNRPTPLDQYIEHMINSQHARLPYLVLLPCTV